MPCAAAALRLAAARPACRPCARPARRSPPAFGASARGDALDDGPFVGAGAGSPPVPALCEAAAQHVLRAHVRPGHVVAVGDGSQLLDVFVSLLARRVASGELPGACLLPLSGRAEAAAAILGLRLAPAGAAADVLVEEAGELVNDPAGGLVYAVAASATALRRSAAARAAAAEVVVLAPPAALVPALSSVPVLVSEADWEDTAEALEDLLLGDASVWRRPSVAGADADPSGGADPLSLGDGTTVVDVALDDGLRLDGDVVSAEAFAAALEGVGGVVAHGLVPGRVAACAVVAAQGAAGDLVVLFPGGVA